MRQSAPSQRVHSKETRQDKTRHCGGGVELVLHVKREKGAQAARDGGCPSDGATEEEAQGSEIGFFLDGGIQSKTREQRES